MLQSEDKVTTSNGESPTSHRDEDIVLSVENVCQEFTVRRRGSVRTAKLSAVADVTFQVKRCETFAIVGETGSGKSTLARTILREPPAKSGSVRINGHEFSGRHSKSSRELGKEAQMVFQDPYSALNPKWTVGRIIAEPIELQEGGSRFEVRRKVSGLLRLVNLDPNRFADRRADQLSGGQCQRVAIARALAISPSLVICDEPVTALDVSIQAQIIKLLMDLKADFDLTYLLIAHDLGVVRMLADRVATMYLGRFCEVGGTESVFSHPAHPYTEVLLSAIPPPPGETPIQTRIPLKGEPPSPLDPPSGCRFRTRCIHAQDICATEEPKMRAIGAGHEVACHFPLVGATSPSSSD